MVEEVKEAKTKTQRQMKLIREVMNPMFLALDVYLMNTASWMLLL